jgi:2-succinyl-5-enolpyruvyl-6-hydroxy-3-cyclohexene-1-carboxylate synthase
VTVDNGRANLATARALVDELARQGIDHAVICPGSRSTPVAVALAAHPDIRIWVHIDERSAAFFALGMARQIGAPVALLSTSGTAAANFLPAVAEAHLSRIPLIVLTADRPPELRDWGAAQTIDQLHLYGSHAKWFADLPVPTDDETLLPFTRATAARAAKTSRSHPPGPVHLNLPFREPLLPTNLTGQDLAPEPLISASRAPLPAHGAGCPLGGGWGEGRSGRGRWGDARQPADITTPPHFVLNTPVVTEIAALIQHEPRGIIICGPGESPNLAAAVTTLGTASGYPILADPLSGVRFGPHDRANLIDAYDPFLRDGDMAARLVPEVVIRVGAPPTSKPLLQFLTAHRGKAHIVIDAGPPRDPSHLATQYVQGNESEALCAVAKAVGPNRSTMAAEWLESWRAADRITREAIEQALVHHDDLSEGGVASDVAALLPDGATLIAGNSMPIRDVDAFVRGDQRRLRVLGNRGANGIDGMTSTALGAAAVAEGPVVLLVGDLSFLHDIGGLMAANLFQLSATIVVVNNDGGGIFSFLPQAEQIDAPTFETLFGTPTGFDIGTAARLFGASHARPHTRCAFRRDFSRALVEPGLSIVEVVTDRTKNVAQHRAVWATVAEALRKAERVGG